METVYILFLVVAFVLSIVIVGCVLNYYKTKLFIENGYSLES